MRATLRQRRQWGGVVWVAVDPVVRRVEGLNEARGGVWIVVLGDLEHPFAHFAHPRTRLFRVEVGDHLGAESSREEHRRDEECDAWECGTKE